MSTPRLSPRAKRDDIIRRAVVTSDRELRAALVRALFPRAKRHDLSLATKGKRLQGGSNDDGSDHHPHSALPVLRQSSTANA